MFKQNVILENKKERCSLFYHQTNEAVSFDSFFNSFNVYLLKKYTNSTQLKITIKCKKEAKVEIIFQNKNCKNVLFTDSVSAKSFYVDLSELPLDGIIFPVVYAELEDIDSISYETNAIENGVKTSILITTFHREEFLIPNLLELKTIEDYLDKVIIVDNGNSLSLDPNVFSKEKFIVIPSYNLGGTGGFTRGMMEAVKIGSSHVFIMDDDIVLIPEVIKKAISFTSCLSEEHKQDWIGFSMFPLDKPLVQYELGTKWNGVKMLLNKRNLDLSKVNNLLKNQTNQKYNYSAWWSLIMPTSAIIKYNYPFPFFIKFDDIEYGLRRKEEEIILTNGFGVWHENFDKKYNPYLEYYLLRNALVTNALHFNHSTFLSAVRYLLKSGKSYFKLQFVELKLMRIAIDDYLKGPSFFKELDMTKNNLYIREVAGKKKNIFVGLLINPVLVIIYIFKILFYNKKTKDQYIMQKDSLTNIAYWSIIFEQ